MSRYNVAANGVCYKPDINSPALNGKNGVQCPPNCKVCFERTLDCIECTPGYLLTRELECRR